MTWADRFAAGQRIGQGLMDSYQTARRQRGFRDVADAQVQQVDQPFTAEDGEQLQAIATARDPNGNPYYRLEPSPDGRGYVVHSNFQAEGQTPQPAAIAPRSQYKFLNKTFDQRPDDQTVERLRYGAMADAVARDDPLRGMEMRQAIKRDERDDTRMGMEVKRFDAEQDERATKKKLEADRREFFKGLNGMDDEALAAAVGSEFSRDGSGVDAMLTFDPQSRKFLFASNVPGMPSRTLSRGELMNYAMGVWEQGNGDFQAGLRMSMDTIREKRRMDEASRQEAAGIARANADVHYKGLGHDLDVKRTDNDAAYKQGALANQRAELGERRRHNQAQEGIASQSAKRAASSAARSELASTAQATTYMKDEQGNVVAVTPVINKKTGEVEYKQAPVGKGLSRMGDREPRDPVLASVDREVHAARQNGASPEEINQIVRDGYRRHGRATPELKSIMESGVNPKTGQPFSPEDVEKYNRMHPNDKIPVPKRQPRGVTGAW